MNRFFLFISICLTFSLPALAQEDSSRQIIPEEFVKARPPKSAASSAGRSKYQSTATKKPGDKAAGSYQQLGLTIWRLRPSKKTDDGVRIIVQEGDENVEWTPERMAANAPLHVGEKIRLSFEAPQNGYLYVIDREKYTDGSMGNAYLIFPTTRTRGGDNKVAPGHLIEIPAQDDRPNFFTLKQTRTDQVGELLTVIVTAQPLEELTIGNKAIKLAPELLAKWEKQWGAKYETFELADGAGRPWTKAEQQAGEDVSRQLTQDDPGPQTIYRVAVKPGAPMFVNVGLQYAKGKAGKTPSRTK
ncbi:MAG: DUF4384 domain-containing protein [Acidobacteria bacterium]|nr:DUF4384 domain-containing protein [Acidobacteriota bacterium]